MANEANLQIILEILSKNPQLIDQLKKQVEELLAAQERGKRKSKEAADEEIGTLQRLEKELQRLKTLRAQSRDDSVIVGFSQRIKEVQVEINRLTGGADQLEDSTNQTIGALSGLGQTFATIGQQAGPAGAVLSKIGGALTGIAGTAASIGLIAAPIVAFAGALGLATANALTAARGLSDITKQGESLERFVGISRELAATLQLVGKNLTNAASIGDLKDGVKTLAEALKQAREENVEFKNALSAIGVTDFTNVERALNQIASKIQGNKEAAKGLALEFGKVFGEEGSRQFSELLETLDEGRARAEKFRLILEDDVVATLRRFERAQNEASTALGLFNNILGADTAEGFATFFESIVEQVEKFAENTEAIEGIKGLADIINSLVTGPGVAFVEILGTFAQELAEFTGFIADAAGATDKFNDAIRKSPDAIEATVKMVREIAGAYLTAKEAIAAFEKKLGELTKRQQVELDFQTAQTKRALAEVDEQFRNGVINFEQAERQKTEIEVRELKFRRDQQQQQIDAGRDRLNSLVKQEGEALKEIFNAQKQIAKAREQVDRELFAQEEFFINERARLVRNFNNESSRLTDEQQKKNIERADAEIARLQRENGAFQTALTSRQRLDAEEARLAANRASREANIFKLREEFGQKELALKAKLDQADDSITEKIRQKRDDLEKKFLESLQREIDAIRKKEADEIAETSRALNNKEINQVAFEARIREIKLTAGRDIAKLQEQTEKDLNGKIEGLRIGSADTLKKIDKDLSDQRKANRLAELEDEKAKIEEAIKLRQSQTRLEDAERSALISKLKQDEAEGFRTKREVEIAIAKLRKEALEDQLSDINAQINAARELAKSDAEINNLLSERVKLETQIREAKKEQERIERSLVDTVRAQNAAVEALADRSKSAVDALDQATISVGQSFKITRDNLDEAKRFLEDLLFDIERLPLSLGVIGAQAAAVSRETAEAIARDIARIEGEIQAENAQRIAEEKRRLAEETFNDAVSKAQELENRRREIIEESEEKIAELKQLIFQIQFSQAIDLLLFQQKQERELTDFRAREARRREEDARRENEAIISLAIDRIDKLNDIESRRRSNDIKDFTDFLLDKGTIEGQITDAERSVREGKTAEEQKKAQEKVDQLRAQLKDLQAAEQERQAREKRRLDQIEAAKADAAKKRASATTAEEQAAIDAELEEQIRGINEKIDAEAEFQKRLRSLKGKASQETLDDLKKAFELELQEIDNRTNSEVTRIRDAAAQKKRIRDEEKAERQRQFEEEEREFIERQQRELKERQKAADDKLNQLRQQLRDERAERRRALDQVEADARAAVAAIQSKVGGASVAIEKLFLDIAKGAGVTQEALENLKKAIAAITGATGNSGGGQQPGGSTGGGLLGGGNGNQGGGGSIDLGPRRVIANAPGSSQSGSQSPPATQQPGTPGTPQGSQPGAPAASSEAKPRFDDIPSGEEDQANDPELDKFIADTGATGVSTDVGTPAKLADYITRLFAVVGKDLKKPKKNARALAGIPGTVGAAVYKFGLQNGRFAGKNFRAEFTRPTAIAARALASAVLSQDKADTETALQEAVDAVLALPRSDEQVKDKLRPPEGGDKPTPRDAPVSGGSSGGGGGQGGGQAGAGEAPNQQPKPAVPLVISQARGDDVPDQITQEQAEQAARLAALGIDVDPSSLPKRSTPRPQSGLERERSQADQRRAAEEADREFNGPRAAGENRDAVREAIQMFDIKIAPTIMAQPGPDGRQTITAEDADNIANDLLNAITKKLKEGGKDAAQFLETVDRDRQNRSTARVALRNPGL